jgi:hypothetical protein
MMSVGVRTRTELGGNRLAPIAAPKAQQALVGALKQFANRGNDLASRKYRAATE